MPARSRSKRGYTYVTAAIPDHAYKELKANADRIHLPMTQAIGLLVVATGPHLEMIATAQQAAADAAVRELVKPDPIVSARRAQQARNLEP